MNSLTKRQASETQATNEALLIDRALQGEKSAFCNLVKRYQQRLYAVSLRLTRSPELAEDLVQETLFQAYCKLHTFRKESAFYSWLFRICFNQYLAHKRRQRLPLYFLEEIENTYHPNLIDTSDTAERLIERSEQRERVHKALQRLDSQSRSILQLREFDGKSYQQISRQLQIKLGTVRSRLSRAKAKLHQVLEHDTESRAELNMVS